MTSISANLDIIDRLNDDKIMGLEPILFYIILLFIVVIGVLYIKNNMLFVKNDPPRYL